MSRRSRGAYISISPELLDDYQTSFLSVIEKEITERLTDLVTGRPRYGPPRPLPEPDVCECCGQEM